MSSPSHALDHTPAARSPWRSIGVWMAVFLVAYMLFNAIRAVQNPTAFATNYGVTPAPGNNAFVLVYAIRALFLGLFGAALVLRRNFGALALFALVAVVMPLGDATLVGIAGGPTTTVIRHLLTAVFLLATWFLLRRWNQTAQVPSSNL